MFRPDHCTALRGRNSIYLFNVVRLNSHWRRAVQQPGWSHHPLLLLLKRLTCIVVYNYTDVLVCMTALGMFAVQTNNDDLHKTAKCCSVPLKSRVTLLFSPVTVMLLFCFLLYVSHPPVHTKTMWIGPAFRL